MLKWNEEFFILQSHDIEEKQMENNSLFGHLASRFSAHPENLSTEALNYILTRSTIARKTFLKFLDQVGIELPEDLSFRTQMAEDEGAIPDLVGKDENGNQVLIVEAKFWAALTDNQPVTYLNYLPNNLGGVLLFIAPSLRFQTIWGELVRRCNNAGITVKSFPKTNTGLIFGKIGSDQAIVLATWRSILSFMLQALESEGEFEIASDIRQLQGLCESMDREAFLPIHAEEFGPLIAKRFLQYYDLVDKVLYRIKEEGLADTKGLTQGSKRECYKRFFSMKGFGCSIAFHRDYWATLRETPLWITVKSGDFKFSHKAKDLLSKLELQEPSRLIQINDELAIPLYLATGVEENDVIEDLVNQVKEIAELLEGK